MYQNENQAPGTLELTQTETQVSAAAASPQVPLQVPDVGPFFRLSDELLAVLDTAGNVAKLNPAFERTLGVPEHRLVGKSLVDVLHEEDAKLALAEIRKLESRVMRVRFEARAVTKSGAMRVVRWSLSLDVPTGLVYAAGHDVTTERDAEAELAELRIEDPNTGAATQLVFERSLLLEWARSRRLRHPMAVALVRMDDFEGLKQRLGPALTDECLREVFEAAIQHARRAGDVVARLGDDTFGVLWTNVDTDTAVDLADRIRTSVGERLTPAESADTFRVTCSIGVSSVLPTPGRNPGKIVRAAGSALSATERQGPNRVVSGSLTTGAEDPEILLRMQG